MFQCSKCLYSTKWKGNLKRHEKICSSKNEKFKHICKVCSKEFNRKNYLTKHMKIHQKEKLFVCHLCKMSFIMRRNLKRYVINFHDKNKIKSALGFGLFNEEQKSVNSLKLQKNTSVKILNVHTHQQRKVKLLDMRKRNILVKE